MKGAVVVAFVCMLAAVQVHAQGDPGDLAALNALKNSITNFAAVSTSPGFMGWNDNNPCPPTGPGWTGVICAGGPRVKTLNLIVIGPTTPKGAEGTLPAALGQLTELEQLQLNGNSFTGTLPPEWGAPGSFTNLKMILLFQNQLSGSFPAAWGGAGYWPALEDLNLQQNAFTGSLPSSWGAGGSLPKLKTIIIQDNMLTGNLPAEWPAQLPSVSDINLGGNKFSCSIPASWGSWASLRSLIIGTNSGLCGPLPSGLMTRLGAGQPTTLPACTGSCPSNAATTATSAPATQATSAVAPAPGPGAGSGTAPETAPMASGAPGTGAVSTRSTRRMLQA